MCYMDVLENQCGLGRLKIRDEVGGAIFKRVFAVA